MKPLEYLVTVILVMLIAWVVMQTFVLKPLQTMIDQTAEKIVQ